MKFVIFLTLSATALFAIVSASPFHPQVSVGAALLKRELSDDEGDIEIRPDAPAAQAASAPLPEEVLEIASQWTTEALKLSSQVSRLQIEGDQGCYECKTEGTEQQGSDCSVHQLLSTAIETGHSLRIQETFAKAAAADSDVSAAAIYSEEELEAVEEWTATAVQLLRALQHANIDDVGDEKYLGCFVCKHPEGGDGAPQHNPGCWLHELLSRSFAMGRGLTVDEVSEQLGAMNLQPNENSTDSDENSMDSDDDSMDRDDNSTDE